jgi:hypothetical protein
MTYLLLLASCCWEPLAEVFEVLRLDLIQLGEGGLGCLQLLSDQGLLSSGVSTKTLELPLLGLERAHINGSLQLQVLELLEALVVLRVLLGAVTIFLARARVR